ncbi:hypothetical protein SOVF_020020, partial [Spinacia oleracea]
RNARSMLLLAAEAHEADAEMILIPNQSPRKADDV